MPTSPITDADSNTSSSEDLASLQTWFAEHVTLNGKPYTLDADQTRAVADLHQNTLVTARAGSGKTRVIVAKIAYLLARKGYQSSELIGFMFNRTAAAEVNQRIAAVKINGRPIIAGDCRIASTFHKFALDLIKTTHQSPQIISEQDQNLRIDQSLQRHYQSQQRSISKQVYGEALKLVQSFVTRAGQKYPGAEGLQQLQHDVAESCRNWTAERTKLSSNSDQAQRLKSLVELHHTALAVYEAYFHSLQAPQLDFNLLMTQAVDLLYDLARNPSTSSTKLAQRVRPLRYILVDEYQDFSYLFFNLIQGLRAVCPQAHLFAVGDDWQAINRFAGSDCDYFLKFSEYFPEDATNIPLATNYRSSRKIVEHANHYMLQNYDPKALPARAFSKHKGKITYLNPNKIRFDRGDLQEDGLGDARYLQALASACALPVHRVPPEAGKLLKLLRKLVKKHRRTQLMFLHRHNFTSFLGITLENLERALRIILAQDNLLTSTEFDERIRFLTMHRSKGLEAEVVILLEMNQDLILGSHPHANTFPLFGDNLANERADQQRLIYVALTRAKERLYILSTDQKCSI